MSVALQSPFSGNKRLFEDDQEQQQPDQQQQQQGGASGAGGTAAAAKRARVLGSPAGRCRPAGQQATPSSHFHHQAGLPPSTVAAVKALFPGMDEKTVENVLAECGQDVDAAIRRLTQLKLGAEQAAAGSNSNAAAAAAAAGQDAAAANGTPQQQDQQQQQQQQQDSATAAAAAAAAAGPPVPQTADQWVDALVQEMASAKDFADARSRAGKLLQAFEQFVSERSKDGGAAAGTPGGRLEEAVRENAILKRAVQIQNAKLQELGGGKDQEVASLKQLLGQYQERLRHLELSNYSLALHLQKATDGQYQPANRPPDVF